MVTQILDKSKTGDCKTGRDSSNTLSCIANIAVGGFLKCFQNKEMPLSTFNILDVNLLAHIDSLQFPHTWDARWETLRN